MRPALRYYGAKFMHSKLFLKYFPPHGVYIEPFAGSAALLLNKQRSNVEVYNDLYDDAVNFFKMLRDCPNELIRLLTLTPIARSEYQGCIMVNDSDSAMERARKFFVASWLNFSGSGSYMTANQFRRYKRSMDSSNVNLLPHSDDLYKCADRLKGVVIENLDYKRVIDMYDADDAFLYVDPPYIGAGDKYLHKFTLDDHRVLRDKLCDCKGLWMVSCNPSDLYEDLYAGYTRVELNIRTSKSSKPELIFMNYEFEEV